MRRSFQLTLAFAMISGVCLAPACSSSSGTTGSNDSGADQSASDTGSSETGSPDGESSDTGVAADSSSPADSGSGTEGGAVTDSGNDGSAAACLAACFMNDPTAYKKLVGYELADCGCAANAPCATECTNECADASTLMMGSSCATCLRTQGGTMPRPACATAAGTACLGDSACTAVVACIQGC